MCINCYFKFLLVSFRLSRVYIECMENFMYFKVLAKCGHVGKNKYTLKWFYIKAKDGKDSARKVRYTARVKHHQKDAIREVIKIEFKEYVTGLKMMNSDEYFQVHNSSDQRMSNCINQEEVFPEVPKIEYKKKGKGRKLRELMIEKDMKKMAQGGWIYDE